MYISLIYSGTWYFVLYFKLGLAYRRFKEFFETMTNFHKRCKYFFFSGPLKRMLHIQWHSSEYFNMYFLQIKISPAQPQCHPNQKINIDVLLNLSPHKVLAVVPLLSVGTHRSISVSCVVFSYFFAVSLWNSFSCFSLSWPW